MATDADFIDYVHAQAALGAALESKKMFGEYALYLDGKVVAFACDNQVFLKPTAAGRALLSEVIEQPPYPGAKNYYLLADALEDTPALQGLLRATADALPAPKPKTVKKTPAKKTAAKKTPAKRPPRG